MAKCGLKDVTSFINRGVQLNRIHVQTSLQVLATALISTCIAAVQYMIVQVVCMVKLHERMAEKLRHKCNWGYCTLFCLHSSFGWNLSCFSSFSTAGDINVNMSLCLEPVTSAVPRIHVVRFTRPSPSDFAYCKRSKTGAGEGLGTYNEKTVPATEVLT